MKSKFILITVFLMSLLYAQTTTTITTTTTTTGGKMNVLCTTPIGSTQFQTLYNNVLYASTYAAKYMNAMSIVNNNCVSAQQVKQLAILLMNDVDKLEFSKTAYRNTVDKDNFYDVYDAFSYFSTVFKLHDYVLLQRNAITNTQIVTNPIATYPVYNYPDYNSYLGITGCSYPIDEASFLNTYTAYRNGRMADNSKVIAIKDIISTTCLSTSQVMKLASIVNDESMRLDILKHGHLRVYDRANYKMAGQLLTINSYKFDFENMINGISSTTTTTTITNVCTVSTTEMDDIQKTLKNISFDNTKLSTAKTIVAAKKCFTVSQIVTIANLFSFDDSKLDFVKYAYDFCSDKSNYYKATEAFYYDSYKNDLLKYIENKK